MRSLTRRNFFKSLVGVAAAGAIGSVVTKLPDVEAKEASPIPPPANEEKEPNSRTIKE